MIRHIVFLKFFPETEEAAIAELEASLQALPDQVPEIKGYEFGRDLVHSPRSFDFALVSLFDDLEALKRYQTHPRHQEVLAKVKSICEHVFAVDYRC